MPFPPAHPALLRAIADRGFTEPTHVQTAVLDPGAAGRDLLVSAQTGSGKTVAYGLALAPTLLGEAPRFPGGAPTRALVIAPTRELALQVQRELEWLYASTGARVVSCVGGMDVRREQRALATGATIVVGTPGRLRDHLERGNLDVTQLLAVVLDEADEMLDLGFREDLEAILDRTPPSRRTLLFSATIPRGIASLARQYQQTALRISTTAEEEPHGDIEYRAIVVVPRERDLAVVNLLRWFEVRGALVFCATRDGVNHLAANLLERGFAVVALSGELSQAERTRALQALRDGRARVCVATDVAARGLDLPDLGLVVHADLPRDRATLLHRSGRTGRAGRKGVAALVVPAPARRMAERLLAAAHLEAKWSPPPSADDIRARDQERLVEEARTISGDPTEDELAAASTLAAAMSGPELALALVRVHRAQLPAPEEVSAPAPARPAASAGGAPRGRRGPAGASVWFRLDLGRAQKADPRWLIPMICQRGGIGKDDIGAIRIGPRETHFEVAAAAASRFAAEVASGRGTDRRNRGVRIEPADGAAPPRPARTRAPAPARRR
jgi:ATP-dependent RNA helicase DeaD